MDYSAEVEDLIKEAKSNLDNIAVLRAHLQQQFTKEFDEGSTSSNRGMLYAKAGTACQGILHELKRIIDDLDLLEDIPVTVGEPTEYQKF